MRPTQSNAKVSIRVCAICGKEARPGSAVVLTYGAGGRVHKACFSHNATLADGSHLKQPTSR